MFTPTSSTSPAAASATVARTPGQHHSSSSVDRALPSSTGKSGRGQQPFVGVLPADQRLGPHQLAVCMFTLGW